MTDKSSLHPLIIYDGVCHLCNGAIAFIIQRDPDAIFRFSPMQSDFARAAMRRYSFDPDQLNTFILLKNERVFVRSTAALEVAKDLSGLWRWCTVFRIIPAAIRDVFYRIIAANRYRWFGRSEHCITPSPELQKRFIL